MGTTRVSRLLTIASLIVSLTTAAHAQREVFGWNFTAHTNTTYINDPYWQIVDYYSPTWLTLSTEGDTLFDVVAQPGEDFVSMRDFADAAEAEWPATEVVPAVQFINDLLPPGDHHIDNLLIRPAQRSRVIGQIAAVVDTLNFDGINIDFEYPSAAMRDSFSVFMSELAGSVAGHVSCAVAAVRADPSITGGFDNGVLSDGAHGDLVIEMVYDKYPADNQTGPTTPLWWWKENADTTAARYAASLSRFALAGPTFGVDYHLTVDGNASRRARAETDGAIKCYFDSLRAVVNQSQATHDNNDDNWPIQWSIGPATAGMPSSYGRDSTTYIPYGDEDERQLWWTGAEDYARFMAHLDSVGITTSGVWCATTNSDSLIWQVFDRWKNGGAMKDTVKIDTTWKKHTWEKWADNDMTEDDNGVVDHPWT